MRHPLHCAVSSFENLAKRVITDLTAVNSNPFIDLYQMWRSKKPRPLPFRTEHRFQIGAHGTFPVRSRHMEHFRFF